jgi:uncharacterized protein YigE (DUF2233 family)
MVSDFETPTMPVRRVKKRHSRDSPVRADGAVIFAISQEAVSFDSFACLFCDGERCLMRCFLMEGVLRLQQCRPDLHCRSPQ